MSVSLVWMEIFHHRSIVDSFFTVVQRLKKSLYVSFGFQIKVYATTNLLKVAQRRSAKLRPTCRPRKSDLFIHSRRPFLFVTPPMGSLDIVWMIVSPRPAHTLRVPMVRDDVVVVRELFMADPAYPTLLPDLAIQQFPHLGR